MSQNAQNEVLLSSPQALGIAGVLPVIVQCLLVFGVVGGLVVAPPASGRMLLLPLDGAARDSVARVAVNAGALLVDKGPLGGSLIVSGERSALMQALIPRKILVLRAMAGGCGSGTQVR